MKRKKQKARKPNALNAAERKERFAPEKVLASWRDAIQALPHMTEEELEEAIVVEQKRPVNEQRGDIIMRFKRRQITLRMKRELKELSDGAA